MTGSSAFLGSMLGRGGRGLAFPGSYEYTLETLRGTSFVFFLMNILSGQLRQREERKRNNPSLKVTGVSDLSLVVMKSDWSSPRAGTEQVSQVLQLQNQENKYKVC